MMVTCSIKDVGSAEFVCRMSLVNIKHFNKLLEQNNDRIQVTGPTSQQMKYGQENDMVSSFGFLTR